MIETPFTEDGGIDLLSFERLVTHTAGTGVTSMMFPGFASEFHKLSEAEVGTLVAAYLEILAAHPGIAPIVSIPTHSTYLARRQARLFADLGAAAVNVLPPSFLGPTAEDVISHIEAVATEVHPLSVILQFAPNQTGYGLSAETVRGIAERHDNLVIVKVESTPPESFIAELQAFDPPIQSFVGYAGLSLPGAVRAGAIGVQPGCSFTELYVRMWNAYAQRRYVEADSLHARLRPFLEDWMDGVEHIVSIEKAISARRGLIATEVVRRPGHTLSESDRHRIEEFLVLFGDDLAEGVAE